mmetsp:Transcript_92713/g.198732  ORF Transcript_92713/g.198732 Transcript_92713/m.198732 type:complete len:279 (+) Transcript_92713:233-1069(+)
MSDLFSCSSSSRRYMSISSSSMSLSDSMPPSPSSQASGESGVPGPASPTGVALPSAQARCTRGKSTSSPPGLPERSASTFAPASPAAAVPSVPPCSRMASMLWWLAMSLAISSMSPPDGSRAVYFSARFRRSRGTMEPAPALLLEVPPLATTPSNQKAWVDLLFRPTGTGGGGMEELEPPPLAVARSPSANGPPSFASSRASTFLRSASRIAACSSRLKLLRMHGGNGRCPSSMAWTSAFSNCSLSITASGVCCISYKRNRIVPSCIRTTSAMSLAEH